MVAASLANMVVGGKETNSANLHNCEPVSQTAAAELLQVSPRSVATAAKVERTAPAEVIEAVKAGNISLNMGGFSLAAKSQEISSSTPGGCLTFFWCVLQKRHIAGSIEAD